MVIFLIIELITVTNQTGGTASLEFGTVQPMMLTLKRLEGQSILCLLLPQANDL